MNTEAPLYFPPDFFAYGPIICRQCNHLWWDRIAEWDKHGGVCPTCGGWGDGGKDDTDAELTEVGHG